MDFFDYQHIQSECLITFFFKLHKTVKRVSAQLQSIHDLREMALTKYAAELYEKEFELHVEDKEFGVECHVENVMQIYHGAIIRVRLSDEEYSTESNSCSFSLGSLVEDSVVEEHKVQSNNDDDTEITDTDTADVDADAQAGDVRADSSNESDNIINDEKTEVITEQIKPKIATKSYAKMTVTNSSHRLQPLEPNNKPYSVQQTDKDHHNKSDNDSNNTNNNVGQRKVGFPSVYHSQQKSNNNYKKHNINDNEINNKKWQRNRQQKFHNNSNNTNNNNNNQNSAQFNNSKGQSFYHQIEIDDEEYQNFEIPEGFPVRLSGVPFGSSNLDICNFFHGLPIVDENGIFFTLNINRNRTGEVFVTFKTKEAKEQALQYNSHYMGPRYVEIIEPTNAQFMESVKISKGIVVPSANRGVFVVKMKGFSFDANEAKIRSFLGDDLKTKNVYVIYDYKNRNRGEAYAEFETKKEMTKCFARNRKYLGKRYINIYGSSEKELRLKLAGLIGSPLPTSINPYLHCLRVEGLPVTATHSSILQFFQRVSVCPMKLHVKPGHSVAYAEFKSQFDCQLACCLNGTNLMKTPIYLIQVNKFELRSIVGGNAGISDTEEDGFEGDGICAELLQKWSGGGASNNANNVDSNININDNDNCIDSIFNADLRDLNLDPIGEYAYEFINYQNNTVSSSPNDTPKNNNNNMMVYGGGIGGCGGVVVGGSNYMSNSNVSNNNFMNNVNDKSGFLPKSESTCISVKGIPFDASPEDVINFFSNYPSFDAKTVRFTYDRVGRFTGNARVLFSNKQEACNAVHNLDRCYIGHRYVFLRII